MVTDRKLKNTFSKVSKLYDSARPSYPAKLVNDIFRKAKINNKSKILDIGCGPGTATQLFAKKNCQIIGIDIGKSLISIAKKKALKNCNISYRTTSFEKSRFKPENFNLIYSAQAWHWIDPNIAYVKAHELLESGGHLALFWKNEEFEKNKFMRKVSNLFVKHCGKKNRKPVAIKKAEKELKKCKLFHPYEKKEYLVKIKFARKKFSDMIHTYSWVIALSGKNKENFETEFSKLLEKQNKNFTIPYKYTLLIAKKK
jgi:ubiquinone/menaquinone biosynthesis C-methylase UbiE